MACSRSFLDWGILEMHIPSAALLLANRNLSASVGQIKVDFLVEEPRDQDLGDRPIAPLFSYLWNTRLV